MKEHLHSQIPLIDSRSLNRNSAFSTHNFKKAVLIMKLTWILLLIFSLHISAATHAQNVNLSEKNASLKSVLKKIRKQTGFYFIYTNQVINKSKPITVTSNNVSLIEALTQVFNSQPISFSIKENLITLKLRDTIPKPTKAQRIEELPKVKIFGRVVDENFKPIAGATITVSGLNIATISSDKGEFSLVVPNNCSLIITYIGYKPTAISIDSHSVNHLLQIIMQQEISNLDQVQVVAYGTTTKRLTTGSESKISATDIQNTPVSDPILAIEGRAPGVFVTEAGGGVAGSNFNIVIQGQNTISAGKLPLYIIDGVPFGGTPVENTGQNVLNGSAVIGGVGFSPLNTLSPDDIESIEILKDADATAIYGSRAANGVIVITTKKGKAGTTKLDVNLYSGVSDITRTLPMLSADQYLDIRKQAFANDGITPTAANAPDLTTFNTGENNNFQKLLIGNTGHFTDASLSLSGGDELTQFLVSGDFRHESPVLAGNFADDKTQVRFNIQHHTLDNKFSITANVSYSKDNNDLPPFNLAAVYNLPPNLPIYNTDGSLAWYTGYQNPAASLKSVVNQSTYNLLSNAILQYNILPGFSFKTDLGYNRIGVNQVDANTIASRNPNLASSATGFVTLQNNYSELDEVEPQLTYTKTIGKAKIDLLAGGTYQYTQFVQPLFVIGSFTSDALYNDLGSISPYVTASSYTQTKYASAFGRANFDWDNKYIINGTFRRDGSSRFSPDNRFGDFGSIGGAWIFSEEDAVKENVSWLSFGKLRSSYGTIGNDQIPDYGYSQNYYPTFTPYNGVRGLYPGNLANNNNYTWEVTKKLDVAIDLGFFKDRILFTADLYRNRTNNLLLSNLQIASQSGFSGYTGNLNGALIQNKGLELELNTTNVKTKDFTWKTNINFTAPQNKLLSYPGLSQTYFASGAYSQGYVVGQSLNLVGGYIYIPVS